MANDTYRITFEPAPARPKFHFSNMEIQQLGISILVLTLAFTIIFSGGIQNMDWNEFPVNFVIAFVAVVTAFFCHELAHKFLAQRYKCWAEFRYWQFGLLIALLSSMMGFLFAAPGAVMIRGNITKSQYGKISVAGPMTNFMIAAGFVGLLFVIPAHLLLWDLAYMVAFINALIGGFNLIPIPPFDGSKILNWSIPVYVGMVAIAVFYVYLFDPFGLF